MICPVILCGGSGARLWPLSRKSYPKQFSNLVGDASLFQHTLTRLQRLDLGKPVLLTHSDYRFIVAEQAADIGVTDPTIIIEPESRNTAPAILSAALTLEHQPDAVMLVMPSDHLIKDNSAFQVAIETGYEAAMAGKIVTFGIKPDRAETGYGYLEVFDKLDFDHTHALSLNAFIEKPDQITAHGFLASQKHLWNAGIFMFRVTEILEAFEVLAPKLMMPCRRAVAAGVKDLAFFRLDRKAYKSAENVSIDYAIMELCETLSVVPVDCGWSDMGSWRSVWEKGTPDKNGVVQNGLTTAIECENTLLRSENDGVELVGIGLDNIMAIAMGDAVLVADMSQAENVKQAIMKLKNKKAKQAETFPRDYRPWGYFETLSLGERFQVKRIVVNPGAALSLQSHVHRAEHWIVVQGSANVTIDDEVKLVSENQSVYIPLGAVHRMENPGKVPLHLIEVQTGSYLGEDDIVRYEDIYARGKAA